MARQLEMDRALAGSRSSIFDRVDWLYAALREHVFRDDTDRIDAALWPDGPPQVGTRLLDVGCGPGTYARRLAERHPGLSAVGIDSSARQLRRAVNQARREGIGNCSFKLGDAMALPVADGTFDAVVASRLLMVLRQPQRALAEIHRVLRPGAYCFIAEPRPGLRSALPTLAMRAFDGGPDLPVMSRVPADDAAWDNLLATQPWSRVTTFADGRYRYAVCKRSRR